MRAFKTACTVREPHAMGALCVTAAADCCCWPAMEAVALGTAWTASQASTCCGELCSVATFAAHSAAAAAAAGVDAWSCVLCAWCDGVVGICTLFE